MSIYLQLGFKIGRNLVLTVNEDNCGKINDSRHKLILPLQRAVFEGDGKKLDPQIKHLFQCCHFHKYRST